MRTHPDRGANVLAPLAAFYPDLSSGVLSHHERWDGTGYPRGLRGVAIPFAARIVSIADAFDAITYGRRYRSAQGADEAAEKLMSGRGTQFDPDLVDLFLSPPVFDAGDGRRCAKTTRRGRDERRRPRRSRALSAEAQAFGGGRQLPRRALRIGARQRSP